MAGLQFTPTWKQTPKRYALDESSFRKEETLTDVPRTDENGKPYIETIKTYRYSVTAYWFAKRSNKRLAAFVGELWDYSREEYSFEEFVENISTSQYGATPHGCWDGMTAWWGNPIIMSSEAAQQHILPVLKELLAAHPNPPECMNLNYWFAFKK